MAWLCSLVLFGFLAQLSNGDPRKPETLDVVVNGNNIFAKRMYRNLRGTTGNLIFSPFSVDIVLAMSWLGASGNTANEIAENIKLPNNKDMVKSGFHSLISALTSNNDITFELANKLYVRDGSSINVEYTNAVKQYFASDVEEIDFSRNDAVLRINKWVEQKTKNKIKDLFTPGSLSHSTRAVLINAVYFRGDWSIQFDDAFTRDRPFRVSPHVNKTVKMMHMTDSFMYASLNDPKVNIVQLDYVEDVKMLILLPSDVNGLQELERKIRKIDLNHIKRNLRSETVRLFIPKFKIETSLKLEDTLKQCGIKQMFEDGANFTLITKNNLKVDSVLQKSFIEVDEKGTTAAVATGVQYVPLAAPAVPHIVRLFLADHPFVFMLYSSRTGAILFIGRVSDPQV